MANVVQAGPVSSQVEPPARPSIRGLLAQTEIDLRLFGMLIALAVILLGFHVISGGKLIQPANMFTLAVQASGIAIIASGMVLIIVSRNIDLSVGSIVGVAAYLTAELLADHRGLPAAAAIAFALGVGAVLGVVNGVLVAVAKVPSIIATLGTLSIYRSLLTNHAGGKTVSTGSLPAWIVDLPRSTLFRIRQYEVRLH